MHTVKMALTAVLDVTVLGGVAFTGVLIYFLVGSMAWTASSCEAALEKAINNHTPVLIGQTEKAIFTEQWKKQNPTCAKLLKQKSLQPNKNDPHFWNLSNRTKNNPKPIPKVTFEDCSLSWGSALATHTPAFKSKAGIEIFKPFWLQQNPECFQFRKFLNP